MAVLRFYLQTTSIKKHKRMKMIDTDEDLTEESDDLPFVDIGTKSRHPSTLVQPDTPTIAFGPFNSPSTEEQLNETVPDAELYEQTNATEKQQKTDYSVNVLHESVPKIQEHQQQQGYSNYLSLITDESDLVDLTEDAELQAAIEASLTDLDKLVQDENLDKFVMQSFQAENLSSYEETCQIVINRKSIFNSTIRAIQRKNFSFFKPVVVTFSGEAGVDVGGPKREFFRLLMQVIKESAIFSGSWFSHDIGLLNDNRYKLCGKLVAWSALQGGGGPRCLSEEGYQFMKGSDVNIAAAIEAVDDHQLKPLLKALESCISEADFQNLIYHHADTIAQYGYSKIYTSKISDKENVIVCLLKQHFIYGVCSEINQFFEGMNEIGEFGELVKCTGYVFSSFLSNRVKNLTVDELKSIYKYSFSDEGSNNKAREDSTVYCFELFLQDLEDGEAGGLSLKDILIFITGSEYIPPLGFGQQITVTFYSSDESTMRRPWSSTCALTLNHPISKAS